MNIPRRSVVASAWSRNSLLLVTPVLRTGSAAFEEPRFPRIDDVDDVDRTETAHFGRARVIASRSAESSARGLRALLGCSTSYLEFMPLIVLLPMRNIARPFLQQHAL
jgi:hypothetical protein